MDNCHQETRDLGLPVNAVHEQNKSRERGSHDEDFVMVHTCAEDNGNQGAQVHASPVGSSTEGTPAVSNVLPRPSKPSHHHRRSSARRSRRNFFVTILPPLAVPLAMLMLSQHPRFSVQSSKDRLKLSAGVKCL